MAMTVVVDDRERCPLLLPLPPEISTVRARLATGDYSLLGREDLIAVERKKASELYCTVGAGRCRFLAELTRMRGIVRRGGVAAIVCEGSLYQVLGQAALMGEGSGSLASTMGERRVAPSHVLGSLVAWSVAFSVPVWFAGGLETAADIVWGILRAAERKLTEAKHGS